MSDSPQQDAPENRKDPDLIVGCFVLLLVIVLVILGLLGLSTDFFLTSNRSSDFWLLDGSLLDVLTARVFGVVFLVTAIFLMLERLRWFKSHPKYKKISKRFVWLLVSLVVILILLSLIRHR